MKQLEEQAELNRELLEKSMYQKGLRWRKKQIERVFNAECADVKIEVQQLAQRVKRGGKIGLHPFLLEGDYMAKDDKIVATLMSALIPLREDRVMRRVAMLRNLLGGSPMAFISGAYKITEYDRYSRGLGCNASTLQRWINIVSISMDAPREMLLSNLDYYCRAEDFVMTREMRESYEEAKFWLCERVLGVEKEKVPIPMTEAVKRAIRKWVPRYRTLGYSESVRLLGLKYDAMVWYASCGVNR